MQPVSTVSQVAIPKRKKRSRFRLIILLLIGLAIAGLLVWGVATLFGGQSNSGDSTTKTEDSSSTTRDFESVLLGFSTKIPKDWEDAQRQEDGFDVVEFTHPDARSNGTPLASALIIRLRDLNAEDKADFFKTYEAALSGGFDTFSETASEEVKVDDLPAKKIEADVEQDGVSDKAIFYLVYAGSDGFSISQTADTGRFSDLESDLSTMISNFKNELEANGANSE